MVHLKEASICHLEMGCWKIDGSDCFRWFEYGLWYSNDLADMNGDGALDIADFFVHMTQDPTNVGAAFIFTSLLE